MAGVVDKDVGLSGDGEAELESGSRARRPDLGIVVVVLVIVAAAVLRPLLEDLLDRPAVAHWATIFVSIAIAAMPFLVLGISISAAIATDVTVRLLIGLSPQQPATRSLSFVLRREKLDAYREALALPS